MTKALNLRGTNGSGKTFVARALLAAIEGKALELTERGKVRSYMGHMLDSYGILKTVVVYGSYEANCGGCDTIPSVNIVADMIHRDMKDPRIDLVFYEGLMISHMIGTVGAAAKCYNDNHTMVFLDTPLEVCIERVNNRRKNQGNTKEFDPRNIVADHPRVIAARRNALAQGFKVVDVAYQTAVQSTLEICRDLISAA